jgi:hypothetical protein
MKAMSNRGIRVKPCRDSRPRLSSRAKLDTLTTTRVAESETGCPIPRAPFAREVGIFSESENRA